jgi:hypothetical protein
MKLDDSGRPTRNSVGKQKQIVWPQNASDKIVIK